jgi:predicted enzyme related to lactoylglutathione lyase
MTKEMFGEEMPPPHFMTYIAVDDVDAAVAKAAGLGATVVREPMDIPNTGRIAVIKDPTGAVFAIFTMKEGGI